MDDLTKHLIALLEENMNEYMRKACETFVIIQKLREQKPIPVPDPEFYNVDLSFLNS